MMIDLPYGKSNLQVNVPEDNLLDILEKEKKQSLAEERRAILESLRNPVGTPSLRNSVEGKEEITIIVDDHTRPCPDDKLLPPLLDELKASGIKKGNIKILIGYGLHSPVGRKGQEDMLGDEIVESYEVVNHSPEDTVRIGTSSRGVPIEVNKHFIEADFRISTGFIEPHFFAGFSGGRKSIMPGISSREAIYGNHGYEMIDNPNSRPGRLEGNPVYEDSLEHAKKSGLDFIVNVLLNREKEITGVFSGNPIDAHLKGVEKEKKYVFQKLDCRADIVITTNSGAPLDLNLYQTVKGIYHASLVTKKNGIIIIASECNEGVGPDSFEKLHSNRNSPDEVIEQIKKKEPIGVQWENQILAKVQKNNQIYLKSSLNEEILENMMINPIKSLDSGLEEVLKKMGNNPKIAVIPEGPMIVPAIK